MKEPMIEELESEIRFLKACNESQAQSTAKLWDILAPDYEGDLTIHQIASKLVKENASCYNQLGDNLDWLADGEDHAEVIRALPEAEVIESCRRYQAQMRVERGVFTRGKTIAQLEQEVTRLEQEVTWLTFALKELTQWPAFYPANENIQRMRNYANETLHGTQRPSETLRPTE